MLDKGLRQAVSACLYFRLVIGIGHRHQAVGSGGKLNLLETLVVRQVFPAYRYAAVNASIGSKGVEVDVMDIVLQHVVLSISIVLEADCNVHTTSISSLTQPENRAGTSIKPIIFCISFIIILSC